MRHEAVEPTNNASERSLRHAVIWRKPSFGTQSAGGSRFVETMLTVIETCRQQRRNAFSFVTAAVEAHLALQPALHCSPGCERLPHVVAGTLAIKQAYPVMSSKGWVCGARTEVLSNVPLPQRSCRIRKTCKGFGNRVPFCHLVIQDAGKPSRPRQMRRAVLLPRWLTVAGHVSPTAVTGWPHDRALPGPLPAGSTESAMRYA